MDRHVVDDASTDITDKAWMDFNLQNIKIYSDRNSYTLNPNVTCKLFPIRFPLTHMKISNL